MKQSYIILGLGICVIILLIILSKYFNKSKPTKTKKERVPEKKTPTNIDFFNKSTGIIAKSTKLAVESEGKIYFLIDIGNGKVLVIEEDEYFPEEKDNIALEEILNSKTTKNVDSDYNPEEKDYQATKEILASKEVKEIEVNDERVVEVISDKNNIDEILDSEKSDDVDVETMKKIMMDSQNIEEMDQTKLFDFMSSEEEEEEEEY